MRTAKAGRVSRLWLCLWRGVGWPLAIWMIRLLAGRCGAGA
ncbi:hypothetical protein [Sporomusa sp.]|nr:hypothetical protein [Sporomusa sp.]HWR05450.1 hypothetical protein [Sporomusa sp.]